MVRRARYDTISIADYYHVTTRGAGRRAIFDDDNDRTKYTDVLFNLTEQSTGALVAWCLMDNHVHLLFHMEIHALSALMQRLDTTYAQYFNGRHGHIGPVFQARFDSRPINTDEHLISTVAYIHRNPKDLGQGDWRKYRWSSFPDYLTESSRCETDVVVELMGGFEGFVRFHNDNDSFVEVRLDGYRRRLNDSEARRILVERLGESFSDTLGSLSKKERDSELISLYASGLSCRQIERLTGVGRNTVSRAILSKSYYN